MTPRGIYRVPGLLRRPRVASSDLPFENWQSRKWRSTEPAHRASGPATSFSIVGANIGAYTRTALAAGAKLVVAIEPGPENLACLRCNLAEEIAVGGVILYEKGVWDKDDVLSFHILPTSSAGDNFLPRRDAPRTVEVLVTTTDKLVSELSLRRVDLMDIEGAENNALLGAIETMRKYEPRMAIAPEHFAGEEDVITATIRNFGLYNVIESGPCEMNPSTFDPREPVLFANSGDEPIMHNPQHLRLLFFR
jgi:FkbM family methyltransferase